MIALGVYCHGPGVIHNRVRPILAADDLKGLKFRVPGGYVTDLDVPPLVVVLGCLLESLSMILLTVPVFYPIMLGLDFGMSEDMVLIWFCIIVVVMTEISLITPPVGMNVFVLPLNTIFRGVMPFIVSDVVRIALLVLFPTISLLLPSLMRGAP